MRAGLLVVAMMLVGCPKRVAPAVTGKTIRLLSETAERETAQLTELRKDLEVDTRDFDRTPHVVATGETPLFSAEGADVRLYGDEAASKGFSVDNIILLEVLGADGKVLRAAVIGYSDPVSQGRETIDNLGRQAFSFEAGELNLAPVLPEHGSFRLRATVLDYFGVGKVSDVFVRVEPKASSSDDLRGQ
ncbi:MAG: hypothetical protein Q8L14_06180 [Myxococcales bacterium]|nr:hypothetical protein [Myxococcales bacterium]